MTTFFAQGGTDVVISSQALASALEESFGTYRKSRRILIIPPDFTRFHSQAGDITCRLHEILGSAVTDVLPALGTHVPMPIEQRLRMYPTIPGDLFRDHDWRRDVETIGTIPAEFVETATEGIYKKEWHAQLNKLVSQGGHDLIISVGQVVPHEVIGMANHNKNLFVGTGGAEGINESHYIGAVYGMERMMGRADTPLRRILNEAERRFCEHLPILYVLTVIGSDPEEGSVIRGLFIGDDDDCFLQACELSRQVNFTRLEEPLERVVVYLDPDEFHSTWLGNKAIYRTRMAIADEGELVVIAPGVRTFGEDQEIDRLIRKYGYRTSEEVVGYVEIHKELQQNLSAAAHMIHGSSENRFSVSYAPGGLRQNEIEGVGYQYRELAEVLDTFPLDTLSPGWNRNAAGEDFYFISNPAQGLWATQDRLEAM